MERRIEKCIESMRACDVIQEELITKFIKLKAQVFSNSRSLDKQFKISLVKSLCPLLRRAIFQPSLILAENIASAIEFLVEECGELPSEIGLTLMRLITIALREDGSDHFNYLNNLLSILIHLIEFDKDYRSIFTSTNLECLLNILCRLKFNKYTDETILSNVINVAILSAKWPRDVNNQITIIKLITPLVLSKLEEWIENPTSSTVDVFMLKDLLFLCREIMSNSFACQEVFLQNKGINMLIRVLRETIVMVDAMDIYMDHIYIVDYARTLFSSILSLLDAAVAHNLKGCQIAGELEVFSVLKEYIKLTPLNQQGIFVMCCVHLLEGGADCSDIKVVNNIFLMATALHKDNDVYISSEVLTFLSKELKKRIVNKPYKRPGTPHPSLFKRNKFPLAKKASPTNRAQTTAQSVKSIRYFINKAELIVFMNCIRKYGVNMKGVRKVYPFHEEISEGDLYALWKVIWKKS